MAPNICGWRNGRFFVYKNESGQTQNIRGDINRLLKLLHQQRNTYFLNDIFHYLLK